MDDRAEANAPCAAETARPRTGSSPLLSCLAAATGLGWALWLVGQLARDRTWLTGLCFYIPSPLLAALCLGLAAGLTVRSAKRTAVVVGLLGLVPAGTVVLVENQWLRPASAHRATGRPPGLVRLIHWNIAYGDLGAAGVERVLLEQAADAYVLSEVPRSFPIIALARRLGAGYSAVRLGSMAVIVDGPILAARRLVHERHGLKLNAVTWQRAGGNRLVLFGVDLPSDLDVARDPPLRKVRAMLEQHRPDITVGDFNAPRRSGAIWPLPAGFRHAYVSAGRGWSYTWPVPLPLYALDQCIVSESSIVPVHYELTSSRFSDHRMQTLEFQVRSALRDAGADTGKAPGRAAPAH